MSREIKFRAWHMPFGPKGKMQEMVHGKASSILAFAEMSPNEYTIEQYTGLKDANGDDIYEGNIVSLDPDEPPYQIIFAEGKFELDGDGLVYDLGEEFMDCVIIGNIHENPELVDGE